MEIGLCKNDQCSAVQLSPYQCIIKKRQYLFNNGYNGLNYLSGNGAGAQ